MDNEPKKTWRRWGIALGSLFLLLFVFLLIERFRGSYALEKYIAHMRQRGERFTVVEIAPAPAPSDKNGATAFLAAVFPTSTLLSSDTAGFFLYVDDGVAVPVGLFRSWMVGNSSEIVFSTNHSLFAVETNEPSASSATNATRRRWPRPGNKVWRTITTTEVTAELDQSSDALKQVREALALGQLDFSFPYAQGFKVPFTHLGKEKTAAQWLRLASVNALQQTNLDGALENLLALAAQSHATTNEVLMIGQLVRIAVLHIAVATLWEALQVEGWSDEQLAKLQSAFAPQDFVRAMTHSFEMERAIGLITIDQATEDYSMVKSLRDMQSMWGGTPVSTGFPESLDDVKAQLGAAVHQTVYYPVWIFAWKDHDKLNLAKMWQEPIERGRAQQKNPNWMTNRSSLGDDDVIIVDGFDRQSGFSAYEKIRFLVSAHLNGVTERAVQRAVLAEAAQQLAVTAVAVCRFEKANGHAPKSLEELTPRFLPSVPIDPFNGQPLRYQAQESGVWKLYSVGVDGKDDGGRSFRKGVVARPNFTLGPDLVWPRAATAEEIEEFARAKVMPRSTRR